ncbi:MAG: hypothetical protein B6U95_00155 [Thermofilum sp. ex4484_82]|nr:MAG: hypothetical protein B6U95_00155 [Thermofilum sp. ex4484_82]OYT40142.1 MAG: hypothetical protein B6U96_00155 [Archaeoglobales archaeon ex4484_92]
MKVLINCSGHDFSARQAAEAEKMWGIDVFLEAEDFYLDPNTASELDYHEVEERVRRFYEEVKKFVEENGVERLVLHLGGDFVLMYLITEYFLHDQSLQQLTKIHVVISRFKKEKISDDDEQEIEKFAEFKEITLARCLKNTHQLTNTIKTEMQ